MPSQDPVTHARNRLAALFVGKRNGRVPDPEAVDAARRNLAIAKAQRAIGEVLAAEPPLTQDQRADLAALLLDGGDR